MAWKKEHGYGRAYDSEQEAMLHKSPNIEFIDPTVDYTEIPT